VNGRASWRLSKRGEALVQSVKLGETTVARDGKLVCILEDRSEFDKNHTTSERNFESAIESVTVEQRGPVRAVVKVQGKHRVDSGDRACLPFTVRLYFFARVDVV